MSTMRFVVLLGVILVVWVVMYIYWLDILEFLFWLVEDIDF